MLLRKNNNKICFYDLFERKIISSINDISKYNSIEWFIMIKKDLLLIPGQNQISIINTNQHNLIRKIEVPGSSWICGVCMLNKNMLFTADYSEIIRQWKIEGDNLILVSKKEKAHDSDINVLLNIGNGLLLLVLMIRQLKFGKLNNNKYLKTIIKLIKLI